MEDITFYMQKLVERINKLKQEKKAVILAHCYQPVEIDLVADYVGDFMSVREDTFTFTRSEKTGKGRSKVTSKYYLEG